MELSVVDTKGKKGKKLQADDAIFAAEVKESVIHAVVRWQRAKQRSGTHATLNLTRMAGGGRKPFKQKGTGRARAGSRNSPLWVGGAVIFGPQPRDYSHKLPRKVKKQALLGVLSQRAKSESISIVDGLSFEKPKTKEFNEMLSNLKLVGGDKKVKITFLFAKGEEAAAVSARNIPTVKCLPVAGVNVYDLLNSDHILMSVQAFEELQAKVSGENTSVEKAA